MSVEVVPLDAGYYVPHGSPVIVDDEYDRVIKIRGANGRTYLLKQILQIAPDHVKAIDIYGNYVEVPIRSLDELKNSVEIPKYSGVPSSLDEPPEPRRIVIVEEPAK